MPRVAEAGIEELIRHWRPVMAYAQSLVASPDDAADLLQEVGLALLLRGHVPAGSAGFVRWCRAVARNRALHYWRDCRRRDAVFVALDDRAETDRPASSASPEQVLAYRDSIESCLRQLDGQSRSLLLLHYVAGETTEEIARRLHRSPAAVRSKLLRARDQFCDQFHTQEERT